MAVLTTFRTARIPHRCSRCRSTTNPGQRYMDSRITPGDEMNDGRGGGGPKTTCSKSARSTATTEAPGDL